MLSRATRVIQEHVKDVTDKTKHTCCVGKSEKENAMMNGNQVHTVYNNFVNYPHSVDGVNYIYDSNSGATYVKGKILGKGGFAKCYEMTDVRTNKVYAGKIIAKNRLTKPHQKEKIIREIELHRSLRHKHVVGFHSYFEDDDSVYIVLELCSKKSLVHVLKNRKTLTEPEVRYYMRHLVDGCKYIHSHNVIHRDLKLGNMLLNDNMQVKIADFGLATRVEYEGEKKMTVCGTPNYIAPEVLQKKGHSFEADIWAMGCVMYAMLVGRPPFETATLKETYVRITTNKYTMPNFLSAPARSLISKLLSADPKDRPTLDRMLAEDFFNTGYTPKVLSTSCCETAPKFSASSVTQQSHRPRSYAAPVSPSEAMFKITSSLAQLKNSQKKQTTVPSSTSVSSKQTPTSLAPPIETVPEEDMETKESPETAANTVQQVPPKQAHPHPQPTTPIELKPGSPNAISLYHLLTMCVERSPAESNPAPVQSAKPLWVTKWVDYSNKYGFGFQLSDKSVGVLFNDTTRMLLAPDGRTMQYNDLSNKVYTYTADTSPQEYSKKATLLLYFAQYMDEHLIHGGDMITHRAEDSNPTGIFMKKWFRTAKAIVMYLNNGTLQVNFFEDHTKVILSPEGQDYILTFINSSRKAVTYRLLQLRHYGCLPDITERLSYAKKMLESIINIEGETV